MTEEKREKKLRRTARTPWFRVVFYVEAASVVSLRARLAKAGVSENELSKLEKLDFNQSRASRVRGLLEPDRRGEDLRRRPQARTRRLEG